MTIPLPGTVVEPGDQLALLAERGALDGFGDARGDASAETLEVRPARRSFSQTDGTSCL